MKRFQDRIACIHSIGYDIHLYKGAGICRNTFRNWLKGKCLPSEQSLRKLNKAYPHMFIDAPYSYWMGEVIDNLDPRYRKFHDHLKLKIAEYGTEHVATKLNVNPLLPNYWLRTLSVPEPGSMGLFIEKFSIPVKDLYEPLPSREELKKAKVQEELGLEIVMGQDPEDEELDAATKDEEVDRTTNKPNPEFIQLSSKDLLEIANMIEPDRAWDFVGIISETEVPKDVLVKVIRTVAENQ